MSTGDKFTIITKQPGELIVHTLTADYGGWLERKVTNWSTSNGQVGALRAVLCAWSMCFLVFIVVCEAGCKYRL